MKKKHPSKIHLEPTQIKTIILSIVIAIVLTSFVIYLTQSIYPRPNYDDYCDFNERAIPLPENKEMLGGTCATVSPDSRQECCENKGYKTYNQETGECEGNVYEECQKQYETASDKYKLIVFVVSVISGLLAISIGIILSLPSVSSGLMLGGTFLTFYGTALYWTNLSNWLRTIILGLVLIILILLAYKKLRN